MSINGNTIIEDLELLASYTEEAGLLTRTFLTDQHQQAATQLTTWMTEAGMSVRIDAAANVIGRYEGNQPGLPALLIGSHYDTVRNAGKYDGAYGVVAGIHCIRELVSSQTRFPFALEVVGFSEEEGVRYNATLLGSRAMAGTFDHSLLERKDGSGITMATAFKESGLDPARIDDAARDARELLGYIELHIEQGPVLLTENLPVGVVTAIAGAKRFDITVLGLAGHAGTVPMSLRQDAATATAEAILFVEHYCQSEAGMVGTVGKVSVPAGAANVIPGKTEFSLDIRAASNQQLDAATRDILEHFQQIAEKRDVTFDVHCTHDAPAAPCSPALVQQLKQAVAAQSIQPMTLPSGAGHDAMAIATITEICMLFVRCGNGGISHHPTETMTADDAAAGVNVLLDFVRNFPAAETTN
ncbi:MAG: allantoate amidohydrolase [Granulosicoccus sp.]|nr:allantoate amidohydrolase [Granulosicoccus sp.]